MENITTEREFRVVNLTPHDINVVDDEGNLTVKITHEETPARVSSETVKVGDLGGIPVTKTVFGPVTGLPPEEEGTRYVVSRMVASAATRRDDLLVPGLQVRDDDGRVIGCQSLDVCRA